ncbi:hypothetical protein [Ruegeria atlantica]|uniref:hypothetical protein n=1 Tax=Ruegeria atlantica TaxID=81569 RepID=UPI002495175F|nr:hypothetical protein [Ruegeria atlantica]
MNSSATEEKRRGPRIETLIILGFVALLLFTIFYVISQRQQVLRSSPTGFDGLRIWLNTNEVSAQSFLGGWQVDQDTIGLLVLPLFDTVLDEDRVHPRTKEELLLQQDEYDLRLDAVLEKASRVQTLVILPKWRSGMRLTGRAHPVLISRQQQIETLLQQLTGQRGARIEYARTPFTDFDYFDGEDVRQSAQIYAAQLFTGADCSPLIGNSDAMLLAECPLEDGTGGARVLVLSDPDLLNNHGLRLGDNAIVARSLLSALADERNVMIDYSREVWLSDPEETVRYERSWADLKRFFRPPFLTLWLSGVLVLALFIWRSWQRFGPVQVEDGVNTGAKSLAVRARARLMRLSDQDGALAGEYAKARLAASASALFGPALAHHYAEPKVFLGYVARHNPDLSRDLETVLRDIRNLPHRIPPAEAMHHVDELEALLEQITNDT